jgi:iron complex transport system substrate-binding protein
LRGPVAIALAATLALGGPVAATPPPPLAPRVVSLDQCADQYVLALSPRGAIAGLSPRARNADSLLAGRAAGLPIRRADRESVLAAAPSVVLRYWGGEEALLADLERRGVRVVRLEDATDFAGVRRNLVRAGEALGRPAQAQALIARMDAELAAARGAWGGRGAVYLTSGGDTAGPATLMDAVLRAAGLRNLVQAPGFHELSVERLELEPPTAIIEGFFGAADQAAARWAPVRLGAVRRRLAGRVLVSLPGRLIGCPAWFAADAALMIADQAPGRIAVIPRRPPACSARCA